MTIEPVTKEACVSRLDELEMDAKRITSCLELLINSRIIDSVCGTTDAIEGRQALYALDSSHLSSSLHLFYSARFQNIPLKKIFTPPRQLNDAGWFHYLHIHNREMEYKSPQNLGFLSKKSLRNLLFLVLNTLAKIGSLYGKRPALVSTLYNLEPTLNSKTFFRMLVLAIKYKIVFFDHFKIKQGIGQNLTHVDTHLRNSLKARAVALLEHTLPDGAKAANYIVDTIPISHLEQRKENFQIAKHIVSKWDFKTLVSANGYASDTLVSFVAAIMKSLPDKQLIGIQHGGYYGYSRNHCHAFNTEYQLLDQFVSWGWTKPPALLGRANAKFLPLGSFHLRELRTSKSRQAKVATQTINPATRPRVLFICGPWQDAFVRTEQQVGGDYVEQYVFPTNANAIARFLELIDGDLYFKGAYNPTTEAMYVDAIRSKLKPCTLSTVHVLSDKLRAFDLYSSYDIVLFDVAGTGFLEAIHIGPPVLLAPSADWNPLRDSVEPLSEKFFISELRSDLVLSVPEIQHTYDLAISESQEFLKTYAQPAKFDFLDYLARLQKGK